MGGMGSAGLLDQRAVTAHVLAWLSSPDRTGRMHSAEQIARGVGVRRPEVRRALSALHRSGLYDVLFGRLTLAGFAVGHALEGQRLPVLRPRLVCSSAVRAA